MTLRSPKPIVFRLHTPLVLGLLSLCAALYIVGSFVAPRGVHVQSASPTALKMRSPGRPPVSVSSAPEQPESPVIIGRVLAANREPLGGAEVCAICARCDITQSPAGHCSTSANSGEFSLADLSEGQYAITASRAGYGAGQARDGAPVLVAAGVRVEPLEIRLSPARASLEGLVLDVTGGPIAGARVQVASVQYSVRPFLEVATDALGRFAVAVPSGKVAIRAEAAGYAPAIIFRAAPSKGAELLLSPGSSIEGTVVDAASGEPVAGVNVQATGTLAASLIAPVVSGLDGTFAMTGLEPGRYALIAEGDHYRGGVQRALDVGLGDSISGVVLPMSSGVMVNGRVIIGDSDRPCTEGYVQLGPRSVLSLVGRTGELAGHEAAPLQQGENVPSVIAHIGEAGEVRLRGLTNGTYYVTLECRGHVYEAGPMTLEVRGEDRDTVWRVTPGLGLIIALKDAVGHAVAHANIALEFPRDADGRRASMGLALDEAGRATVLGSLYPGSYVIHVEDSYGVEPQPIELRAGSGTTTTELAVSGTSALRVRVHSKDGKPVGAVHVAARVVSRAGKGASAESGSAPGALRTGLAVGEGEFSIQSLAAGEYTVQVDDGVNPPWVAQGAAGPLLKLESGQEVLASATIGCDGALSGAVTDDAGVVVVDAWVSVSREGQSGGDVEGKTEDAVAAENEERVAFAAPSPRRVLSDGDGHFRLEGLCAEARYRVRAVTRDGAVGELRRVQPRDGLAIVAPRAGALEGTVLLPDGRPAREYLLTLHHGLSGEARGSRVRAADGRFDVQNMPSGPVNIDAQLPGMSGRMQVVIPPNERLGGLRLVLAPIDSDLARGE